jgi:hypothetical protein
MRWSLGSVTVPGLLHMPLVQAAQQATASHTTHGAITVCGTRLQLGKGGPPCQLQPGRAS